MEALPVHLFKDSFGPFMALLSSNKISFTMHEQRSGVVMASSGVVEVLTSPAVWGALATVIVAYINSKNSRKVIITLPQNTIVHAEGLSREELELVLKQAKSLAAIETKPD